MEHFNNLTPAQAERLALLIEELGEAIQAAGKILRHGYNNFHPDYPGTTNRLELERELGHVQASIHLMLSEDIDKNKIEFWKDYKLSTVKQWMHHQGE